MCFGASEMDEIRLNLNGWQDKDRARDVLASIMVDYPEALDNKLHKFFIDTEVSFDGCQPQCSRLCR